MNGVQTAQRERWWSNQQTWLWFLIGAFALYLGLVVVYRQANLYTAQFDLGNMEQVLWQSLHGRWFQMVDPGSATLISRAAIHTDLLLLIYLPFYALWHSPIVMMLGQVLAVASGALPLYWLARKRVSATFALIIASLYLLNPALHWATMTDVHAVVLVTPLILWAWWAVDKSRWWLAALLLGLALLGKEEVGLVVAMNGIFWLFQRRTRFFGLAALITGLSWSSLMVGLVIPHARGAPGHFALDYYSAYGATESEILRMMVTKPWIIVRDLLRPDALQYYRGLVLPVAGLPILGLPILLIALPEFAINILSKDDNLQSMFFHYTSSITPYIFLAAVWGWSWATVWMTKRFRFWTDGWNRWSVAAVGCVGAFFVWWWAPLPGLHQGRHALDVFHSSPYRAGVTAITKLVNPHDRLAVTNTLAPHFTGRDAIWGFPRSLDSADGIIVLTGGAFELAPPAEIDRQVNEFLHDSDWTLVYRRSDLYYFRPSTTKLRY